MKMVFMCPIHNVTKSSDINTYSQLLLVSSVIMVRGQSKHFSIYTYAELFDVIFLNQHPTFVTNAQPTKYQTTPLQQCR